MLLRFDDDDDAAAMQQVKNLHLINHLQSFRSPTPEQCCSFYIEKHIIVL